MTSSPDGEGSLTFRAACLLTGKLFAFALSFALPLLLVRRLGREDFGLYKQVFLVVGTALNTLPLGFGMSAYYFLPREREHRGQIVFNIAIFYLVMSGGAGLVLAFAPGLLAGLFNTPEVVAYGPMVGLVVFLWVVSSFLESLTLANGECGLATAFVIGGQASKTLLLLGAALAVGSVRAIVIAAIVQGAIQTAVLAAYMRTRFGAFWRSFDGRILKEQLAYALPVGIGAMLLGLQIDLPHYFVSYDFDPATYAAFAVGCFSLPVVGILSDAAGSVMIARVSYLASVGDRREILETTARMVRKLAAALLPIYAFLLVTRYEFVTTLFTKQYAESVPLFAINLTLIPLGLLTSACDPVVRAYPEHKYYLLRTRAALLAALAAALWVVTPRFGPTGAIVTVVAVGFVERLVTARRVARALEFERGDVRLFTDVAKLGAASLAAGLVTEGARRALEGQPSLVSLAACAAVFGMAYVIAVALFGVPAAREWALARVAYGRLRRLHLRGAVGPAN